VIIAADLASLNAHTRVLERLEGRRCLREEPCLHLLCNFQFLSGTTLGFQLFGNRTALRFNFPTQVVPAHKREGVSIQIFESSEGSAPSCWLRRMTKVNPALTPGVECGDN